MKKRCAALALKKIRSGMVLGLGGGSTIGYLVDMIKETKLDVQIVTPSEKTKQHCINSGLTVLDTAYVSQVDLAFDGCDEVDEELIVLKSMGGIHTEEKIIAQMAKEYIVLVDESKVSKTLSFKVPLTLEVVKEAIGSVIESLKPLGTSALRMSQTSDSYTYTSRGTVLIDFIPQTIEFARLNQRLLMTPGIVDTSLFYKIATGAIVVTETTDYELTGGKSNV
ncbi:ribose 5-phosphate isomerase A [uncultured Enterococcus sp.]|uniref:ribose 5-phosphate isomerase A n=1 Tax=uncultured Enterococcus sp. TaxID=167972 RepID=UPI0025ECCF11|nr:ribose 5-phosphate isomerase A [uncultured Enterococcus sp.]